MTAKHIVEDAWYYRGKVKLRPNKPPIFTVSIAFLPPPSLTLRRCHLQGFNPSCICGRLYIPQEEHQRYCTDCEKWIHVTCTSLKTPDGPPDLDKTKFERLLHVPIMRGQGEGEGRLWTLVGTSLKLRKVREWVEKGGPPEKWRELLRPEFVDDMVEKTWARYDCPGCGKAI